MPSPLRVVVVEPDAEARAHALGVLAANNQLLVLDPEVSAGDVAALVSSIEALVPHVVLLSVNLEPSALRHLSEELDARLGQGAEVAGLAPTIEAWAALRAARLFRDVVLAQHKPPELGKHLAGLFKSDLMYD